MPGETDARAWLDRERANLVAVIVHCAGNTYQQASAHRELAESYHGAGQDDQARHHWQQALTLYLQLGAPEADQVRTWLSTYGHRDASSS